MDQHIAAALEEFVTETQRLLDAAEQERPRDADEVRFWRAQRSAFVKAQTYYLNGVRLTETPSGYTVPSASRPGALIHRCTRVGGIWTCSCEAGDKGIFHWHTALIAAYERGAELAALATEHDEDDLEMLDDRAAAADILADAAAERAAMELGDEPPARICRGCGESFHDDGQLCYACLSRGPKYDTGRSLGIRIAVARSRYAA